MLSDFEQVIAQLDGTVSSRSGSPQKNTHAHRDTERTEEIARIFSIPHTDDGACGDAGMAAHRASQSRSFRMESCARSEMEKDARRELPAKRSSAPASPSQWNIAHGTYAAAAIPTVSRKVFLEEEGLASPGGRGSADPGGECVFAKQELSRNAGGIHEHWDGSLLESLLRHTERGWESESARGQARVYKNELVRAQEFQSGMSICVCARAGKGERVDFCFRVPAPARMVAVVSASASASASVCVRACRENCEGGVEKRERERDGKIIR